MTRSKPSKEISRRSFLKLAGLTLGTSLSLAACDIMRQEEQMTFELDLRRLNLEPSSNIPGPQDLPPPGELGFFTQEEALFSFAVMLLYDGLLTEVTGVSSYLTEPQLAVFERRAQAAGLPYRREGPALAFKLKQR